MSEPIGARKSSCYLKTCCMFIHFMSREIRTLRTNMAIVFPFPAMDVPALARGLDGSWGLKSQKKETHRWRNEEGERRSQFVSFFLTV